MFAFSGKATALRCRACGAQLPSEGYGDNLRCPYCKTNYSRKAVALEPTTAPAPEGSGDPEVDLRRALMFTKRRLRGLEQESVVADVIVALAFGGFAAGMVGVPIGLALDRPAESALAMAGVVTVWIFFRGRRRRRARRASEAYAQEVAQVKARIAELAGQLSGGDAAQAAFEAGER